MQQITVLSALSILIFGISVDAFAPLATPVSSSQLRTRSQSLFMAEEAVEESTTDGIEEEELDAGTLLQLEKQRKVDELKSQEVFIQRSTGKYGCSTCDWEYDEAKGDSFTIGGQIQPGTAFDDLPSNWRCPSCRASKDNFLEITEEIPGFEVNQGYGLGGNSMTSGQKNSIIFGGLGVFFILFLGGYGLS
jgi:rubredoxin